MKISAYFLILGAVTLTACAPKVDERAVAQAVAAESVIVGSAGGPQLSVGVFGTSSVTNAWSGRPNPNPELASRFVKGGRFSSAEVMDGEICRGACDAVVYVSCSEDLGSDPAQAEVESPKDRKTLFSAKSAGSCEAAAENLGAEIAKVLAPGTRLYGILAAQRGASPLAPPPPPPATVSASDVDAPSYRLSQDPRKFALVVGIENYSDLPAARFAERDASAMHDHLLALGYPERNIITLEGQKASSVAIKKYLESWLPRNVGEDSTVFVYYSGHGAPDPKSGEAYLVPWDGDPQFLGDTAYPVSRLYRKLGELKARRVVVALDACFSGAGGRSVLAKGARPLVTKVSMGETSGRVVALTASGSDQISGALEAQGHGIFTYYLLKGLNGAAGKTGGITARSLFDYLSPMVADEARRQNREQVPQILGTGGAETELR